MVGINKYNFTVGFAEKSLEVSNINLYGATRRFLLVMTTLQNLLQSTQIGSLVTSSTRVSYSGFVSNSALNSILYSYIDYASNSYLFFNLFLSFVLELLFILGLKWWRQVWFWKIIWNCTKMRSIPSIKSLQMIPKLR